MIAPDLSNVRLAALKYFDSGSYTGKATTAEEYIHESIMDPNLFVAPTCPHWRMCIQHYACHVEGCIDSRRNQFNCQISRWIARWCVWFRIREPTTVRIDLDAVEVEGQLADGNTFTYWIFNGAVPGPFFRVRLGDTIEVHIKNNTTSAMHHSVDFHAVTGPGGGAVITQPGQESVFTTKALNVGLFVYHCATPMVAHHISNGMYGPILVEPEGSLPLVDHEFYVMQGDIYTTGAFGEQGKQTTDITKMLDEDPEYIVFNGAVGALTTQKSLKANLGETMHIFFGVGEIFDRVYDQASLTGAPLTDVQTTIVPHGGATMVEFGLEVPGNYIFVDYALSRLQHGLVGFLIVEGPAAPEIFLGTPSAGSGH